MFLSFPSTKDSEWSARFPGKSTAHIISEAPLEWFEEWRGDGFRVRKRGKDYEALKAELTKRLLVRNPPPTPCLRLRVATVWPGRKQRLSSVCCVLGRLVQAPMFAEFPQLVGKVLFSELGTPLSSEHYLGTPYSYGLAHTPGKTQR